MKKQAFTLIELLVVIAIIAILAAILFPVFAQAKAAAKRTADLSNVKNMTLGMILYTGDYDDTAVPVMQGFWDQPRYNLILWKDSILPYIKNGGKYPRPGQPPYTRAEQGDGGVFNSPTYSNGWVADPGTGVTGDTSSRFPRSYALNVDAGKNERMGPVDGSEKNTIFPWVDYWSWETPSNRGGSGNMTALESPAGTAMITGSRTPYPNIQANYLAYRCDPGWCGEANQSVSYMRGVGQGMLNLGYFDGHAKATKAQKALADDAFGLYQYVTTNDWPGRAAVLGYMRDIPEWK